MFEKLKAAIDIRIADELVQMIAHFYYNAKRPSCVNPDDIAPPF